MRVSRSTRVLRYSKAISLATFVALSAARDALAQTDASALPAADPSSAKGPSLVRVHIEASSSVDLQVRTPGNHWETVCSSPCDKDVESDATYRIGGFGVRNSSVFTIEPGKRVSLEVEPASSLAHGAAVFVTVIGVVGLAPGAALTAIIAAGELIGVIFICPIATAFVSKQKQAGEYGDCLATIATYIGQGYKSPTVWVPAIVGGVSLLGGIIWLATGSPTTVTKRPVGASTAGTPATWRLDVATASWDFVMPRPVTVPVLNLRF